MRRLRKLGSVLTALALCFTLLPVTAGAEEPEAADSWDSRADTSWYVSHENDSTYTISTAAELAGLAAIVNGTAEVEKDSFSGKTITLTADIDLEGREWTPIGIDNYSRFNGTFDGGGHTISGMCVTADISYSGLFGYINSDATGDTSGKVKNLTVSGSITGHRSKNPITVGGVAGENDGSITNCRSDVRIDISASSSGHCNVGGVAGMNTGSVANCHHTDGITVSNTNTGNTSVGGVVGDNGAGGSQAAVSRCFNTGRITCTSKTNTYVGGVVGTSSENATITDCYNVGAVTTTITKEETSSYTGGVVGDNSKGEASNCYNTGAISDGNGSVGGVVGKSSGTVTNCYYLTDTANSDGGNAQKVDSARDIPIGGDNGLPASDWMMSESLGRPILISNPEGMTLKGDGLTEDTAFQIPDLPTLEYFRDLINEGETYTVEGAKESHSYASACYVLTEDIDMNPGYTYHPETDSWTEDGGVGADSSVLQNWTPIGTNDHPFTGTFEGNNHTISGLYIDNSDTTNYYGLFGYVGEGTVQNLTVSGSVTTFLAGGVVGRNKGGTVANCHNQANVATNDVSWFLGAYVGGVVGWNDGGTVTNCRNTGRVSHSISQSYAGGVVGYNVNNGRVTNCRNAGQVTASKGHCGGVVGYNGSNSRVTNCRNTGPVTGGSCPGGVVGHNYKGTVASCCNTGPVTSTSSCGGVVGECEGGTTANCYNAGSVTSNDSSRYVGGVVGNNHATGGTGAAVMNCYNTGMVTSDSSCGGVVGSNSESSSVTHCYFLQDASHNAGLPGVGSGEPASAGITALDSTGFVSGQVAWELQNWWDKHAPVGEGGQVWGQNLGEDGDESPVLTGLNSGSPRVYQLTFQAEGAADAILYGNSGSLPFPAAPTPPAGQSFTGWFSGDTRLTEATEITADIVAVARFGTTPEPEPTPPSQPSGGSDSKPSYSPILDVGDGGTVRVSPRTPEAGDTVTITPTPDEGYKVGEVLVTDRNGDEVKVTAHRNGTYSFTQPRGRVTIEVTFREIQAEAPLQPHPFLDVPEGAWYSEAVQDVYENGLMTGTTSTTFSPNEETTRAQIVTILWRLAGSPETAGGTFSDVSPSDWYAQAVSWASRWGIAEGYEDGRFDPNDPVTREQLAVMLYQYAWNQGYDLSAGENTNILSYTDAGQISEYAFPALQWACGEGLLSGTSSATLEPAGQASRAQVAVILMRFCQVLAD